MAGRVPVGARDLHQAVAQQQHQQEQAPGVGRRDADRLQLVPEEGGASRWAVSGRRREPRRTHQDRCHSGWTAT